MRPGSVHLSISHSLNFAFSAAVKRALEGIGIYEVKDVMSQ